MRATYRPLPVWPYPERPHRHATYRSTHGRTLDQLENEVKAVGGSEVIIGLVITEADVRMDGMLRSGAQPTHPGVEVSFEMPDGRRRVFYTDTHRGYAKSWQDNLRAIVLGLEALRAVNRYGMTAGHEQYAGFLQLESGPVDRGRRLVEEAGSIEAALKQHHPDRGGDARAFRDVIAYRGSVG